MYGTVTCPSRLEMINLSACGLRLLPGCLFQLTQLRELRLSMNQMESMPATISQLRNLRMLESLGK